MEKLFDKIIEHLFSTSDTIAYFFLFLSAVVENLFPPIPGDTITAFGAFLVGIGRLQYIYVYIVTTLGSVAGFMILFFIGKFFGREFFMKKDYKYFSKETILKTEQWFVKYGYWIVLANRFLPGIRSVISIVSGISNLNTFRVFMLSLASASVWNLIWIQVGYMLGDNWTFVKGKMQEILKGYNLAVTLFLVFFLITFFIVKKFSSKSSRKF